MVLRDIGGFDVTNFVKLVLGERKAKYGLRRTNGFERYRSHLDQSTIEEVD
jgi:hypothetical protein